MTALKPMIYYALVTGWSHDAVPGILMLVTSETPAERGRQPRINGQIMRPDKDGRYRPDGAYNRLKGDMICQLDELELPRFLEAMKAIHFQHQIQVKPHADLHRLLSDAVSVVAKQERAIGAATDQKKDAWMREHLGAGIPTHWKRHG